MVPSKNSSIWKVLEPPDSSGTFCQVATARSASCCQLIVPAETELRSSNNAATRATLK